MECKHCCSKNFHKSGLTRSKQRCNARSAVVIDGRFEASEFLAKIRLVKKLAASDVHY